MADVVGDKCDGTGLLESYEDGSHVSQVFVLNKLSVAYMNGACFVERFMELHAITCNYGICRSSITFVAHLIWSAAVHSFVDVPIRQNDRRSWRLFCESTFMMDARHMLFRWFGVKPMHVPRRTGEPLECTIAVSDVGYPEKDV